MDWLTFISSVIKSVALPATLIVALVMVRRELPALVHSLRKLTFKGLELQFGEAAKEAAKNAKNVLPAQPAKITGHGTITRSSATPRGQILESWLAVEQAAVNVLRYRVKPGDSASPRATVRQLLEYSILDPGQASVMDELRKLRNQAVHMSSMELTQQTVDDYSKAASALTDFLSAVPKPTPSP